MLLLSSYCSLSRPSYFLALIPCLLLDLAWAFRSLDSTFYRLSLQHNVFSAIVMKLAGTLLRYGNYHRWPINMMIYPCILCSHFCIRRITVSWVTLLLHSARQELFDYCAWRSPANHNVWSNTTWIILRRAGSNLSLLSTLNIWQHCHACRHRNTEKWIRRFWPIAAGY